MYHRRSFGSFGRRRTVALATLLSAGLLGACDSLLEVELPGNMTEAQLYQPSSATTMVNSAIADFECSYSMFTALTAAMEDVWLRGTGYWNSWAEYRQKRPDGGECATGDTNASFSTGLQKSRLMSETAYSMITEWTGEGKEVVNAEQLLATSATYAGLVYQIFGETFCELTVDSGPLMTPEEVLQRSESWFTTALNHMGGRDMSIISTESLKQLAHLGRARVRLRLGDLEGARADAEKIEKGFVAYVTRDNSTRPRWNHVYRQLNVNLYAAVAPPVHWQGQIIPFTGYQGLSIAHDGSYLSGDTTGIGIPDPRVPTHYSGQFLQDGVTDNWVQLKYTSTESDIPLARWAEAQLILAELEGGQSAVNRINALRDVHGLPHYRGSTSTEAVRDLIIEEKRREFFFEGRFLAEKTRKDLWFPNNVGANHKGVLYGDARCFMMPLAEYQNNPNIPLGYEGPY